MKIGLFLAYAPQTNLKKEGLGRYIGGLVKGFADRGQPVLITMPSWLHQAVSELFSDFCIPTDAVEFAELEKLPALWGLYTKFKRYRKKGRERDQYRVLRTTVDWLEKVTACITNVTNMLLLVGICALLFIIAILLLPLLLIGFLLMCMFSLFKGIAKTGKLSIKAMLHWVLTMTATFSKTGQSINRFAYEKMMEYIMDMLICKANRQDVDVWLVPSLFWPETKGLKKTRVITVPDVVTLEFPELCSEDPAFAASTKKCVQTIEGGDYFITFCPYVKKSLLERQYGKRNVTVIPHPNNSLNHLTAIDTAIGRKLNASKDFTLAFARSLLQGLLANAVYGQQGLFDPYGGLNFSFKDTRYIFYPSQARPYKNLFNLIRAYEELLRRRYVNVKLYLTCDLKLDKRAYAYVMDKKLLYDVVCFHNVSAQALSALYRCAELVVNPTLYEGGFPFTFGEGMSVGTPSVMSNIPQTREVVEPYGLAEQMLFDPYDWYEIANAIEYGLTHRDELRQAESPLYEAFERRTGDTVAEEYVHAFEEFIKVGECAAD